MEGFAHLSHLEHFEYLSHISHLSASPGGRLPKPRVYGLRHNYFEVYDEQTFIYRFRLSKSSALYVLDKIRNQIRNRSKRSNALSPEEMLCLTLRFYASGSFLVTVGDFCGVSVATASRVVKKVSFAIAQLSGEFIKLPTTRNEIVETSMAFYRIAKFPKVIGCIDCTHVRIQSPGGEDAEIFRNRKGYFSFNVQAVCKADLEITDIVCRWPGSSHDSNIFNNSRLKYRLEENEFRGHFLLGDSGYGVGRYMMTPLLHPSTAAERLYNESQIRTRNCIERCFGVWKRRFPVLSIGIRVSKDTAMLIVVACAVLHKELGLSALPKVNELYACNTDAVPILHDTAMLFKLTKFTTKTKKENQWTLKNTLNVEGSITQCLQISRSQNEQVVIIIMIQIL